MRNIDIDEILKIVKTYLIEHKISLSEYAKRADISKAWLSRLFSENKKQISFDLAQRLLNVSGHELRIVKSGYTITKIKRLGKRHEITK